VASCGGNDGGGGDQDAHRLLERAFSTDVDSGEIRMEMEVEVDGVEGADGPFRLELSGPFRSRGPTDMPDVDVELSASRQGASFEDRAVLLAETPGSSSGTRPTKLDTSSGPARSGH
jgi:hypothetical protein